MRLLSCFSAFLLILVLGCSKHFPDEPSANQPPHTYVALMPDNTLSSAPSQQHLHWWGVDPDGFVKGYYLSFDSLQWTYTTLNDSLFGLKIARLDTNYRFFVAAVDNQGLIDPLPARLMLPIHNTPPVVSFVTKSDVPESTFTVATFQWNGSDVDGNETILNYLYALDDTTNPLKWKALSGGVNSVTLRKSDGLTEGRHVFYLRARDIAGSYSGTIRMPIDTSKFWYVKEPKGDFLIVDDYGLADATSSFYTQLFDTLMGGRLKARDVWDIKTGYSNTSRGKYVPALINPTFSETMKLFKYVFWYADYQPQLEVAQGAIPDVKKAGIKILFVNGFSQYPPDQRGFGDFAPVENIETDYFTSILLANDSVVAVDPSYPRLTRDGLGTIYQFPRGLLPKVNARIIYQMGRSPRWASRDALPIIMGVKDADQPSFVMVAVLLHRFVGNGTTTNNVPAFLRKVFVDEFGVH
jgi:hypothetical protein